MSCLYEVKCNDCGTELTHDETMDVHGDIYVVVDACVECMNAAVEDYKAAIKSGENQ